MAKKMNPKLGKPSRVARDVPQNCSADGCEVVSSQSASVPVDLKKQKPTSLEAIVAKVLREQEKAKQKPADFDDLDQDEDELPATPHEYVYDDDLGSEITRLEKQFLDSQRQQFDNWVKKGGRNAGKNKNANSADKGLSPDNPVGQNPNRADKKVDSGESATEA